jgi:hypothetical protein
MTPGLWRRKAKKPTEELERCPVCGAGVELYAQSCPACSHELLEEKIAVLRKLRDTGTVSAAAFDEIVRLLVSGAEAIDAPASLPPIRKRVGDLAPSDLQDYPTWEFAIDEEGEGGDEETVRPRPEVEFVDPAESLFIVRAEFVAADGTRLDGFVSPHEKRHVAHVQPTIVTDKAHVLFWFGIVPPTRAELNASYSALGKAPEELFPLRYRAVVEHAGSELEGEINGFMHYEPGHTKSVTLLT